MCLIYMVRVFDSCIHLDVTGDLFDPTNNITLPGKNILGNLYPFNKILGGNNGLGLY